MYRFYINHFLQKLCFNGGSSLNSSSGRFSRIGQFAEVVTLHLLQTPLCALTVIRTMVSSAICTKRRDLVRLGLFFSCATSEIMELIFVLAVLEWCIHVSTPNGKVYRFTPYNVNIVPFVVFVSRIMCVLLDKLFKIAALVHVRKKQSCKYLMCYSRTAIDWTPTCNSHSYLLNFRRRSIYELP